MNGFKVGELTRASDGALSFRYDSAWLKPDAARPLSRSMPLGTKAYHTEAYNYFDNLLPDNPRIRERIQGRFDAATGHPYDLLAAIGHDCVGERQWERQDTHHYSWRYPTSYSPARPVTAKHRSAPFRREKSHSSSSV
ncbi:MAG: HipA N-terminal domain-containing protein [Sedimenticola sp.]